jgi:hypothetical protein
VNLLLALTKPSLKIVASSQLRPNIQVSEGSSHLVSDAAFQVVEWQHLEIMAAVVSMGDHSLSLVGVEYLPEIWPEKPLAAVGTSHS